MLKKQQRHAGKAAGRFSAFECGRMTEERLLNMIRRLEQVIDHSQDSVRYYPLCRACLNKVEFSGTGEGPREVLF